MKDEDAIYEAAIKEAQKKIKETKEWLIYRLNDLEDSSEWIYAAWENSPHILTLIQFYEVQKKLEEKIISQAYERFLKIYAEDSRYDPTNE